MNFKELKDLALIAAKPESHVGANFSAQDAQSAFHNGLLEYLAIDNVKELTYRDIRGVREQTFAIVEEIIDEVLPALVEDFTGQFATVKTYGREEEPIYHIKNINKNRVMLGISGGARGGIYKARRLDNRSIQIAMKVETVAYMQTLEDLILGRSTIGDLLEIITRGFVERTLIEVIKSMRGLKTAVPAANVATAATNTPQAIGAALDLVTTTIKHYGRPIILAFDSVARNIVTLAPENTMSNQILQDDLIALRDYGYVKHYKGGVPVVVLPNYFIDETNSSSYFKEEDIWILPADNKPVIIGIKGEAYTQEVDQAAGGKEFHMHKLMGVAILFNNQVGMVTVTGANGGLY